MFFLFSGGTCRRIASDRFWTTQDWKSNVQRKNRGEEWGWLGFCMLFLLECTFWNARDIFVLYHVRCLRANRLAVCVYCFYFQLLTDFITVLTKQNILAGKYMMATCWIKAMWIFLFKSNHVCFLFFVYYVVGTIETPQKDHHNSSSANPSEGEVTVCSSREQWAEQSPEICWSTCRSGLHHLSLPLTSF